jgi:hypothetical protein
MLHYSILACVVGAVGSAGCAGLLSVPCSWRRVGELRFWRVGRIGGSFYVASRHGGAVVQGVV